MNITHHPSDELMLDYASGALSEGWALAVATHLSMCDSSSGLLRGMETIGGILLDCLLYTSPSPRDVEESRMPSSA